MLCYDFYSDVDPVGSAFIWVRRSGSTFRMRIRVYKMKGKAGWHQKSLKSVPKKVANFLGLGTDF